MLGLLTARGFGLAGGRRGAKGAIVELLTLARGIGPRASDGLSHGRGPGPHRHRA